MIIGLIVGSFILGLIFFIVADVYWEHTEVFAVLSALLMSIALSMFVFGCFHGFINYKPTEGTHQGVITAVDLEGNWFRRYEVYLKSSGYTEQSDETKYLIYEYEKDLAEKLQNAIGKTVKIYYGHDGGYIPWNSCGTYHIKNIEIIE